MTAKNFRSGSLGDVGMSGTFEDFTGDAVDISDLEDVTFTMKGTGLDASAAMTLQYSQDGTNWAATPTSSACDYSADSASYTTTGRVRLARALCSACATGSFAVRYAGRNSDGKPARFGTLGSCTSQAANTAVDVSELEKVIVTVSGSFSATVKVQASYNGTDWINVGSFTAAGSVLVPFPCMSIRANCTAYSTGTAYVRFGGQVATGKQRFGTLGQFTSGSTGTAVDVQDLDEVKVYAQYTDSGTFTATATIVLEQSQDGTSWALCPGSSSLTSAGSFTLTAPARLLRARCSSYTIGTVDVRFGGKNTDLGL